MIVIGKMKEGEGEVNTFPTTQDGLPTLFTLIKEMEELNSIDFI